MKENRHESDTRPITSGVRLHVLIPLSVAMIILIAAFVLIFVFEAGKRQAEDNARTAASVENLFKTQSTEGVQIMTSIMELVMRDQLLEAAFRARDRKTLFDVSEPILNKIRVKNRITHFYYILPDRTTLLRVHIPDNYGDSIDRFTLLEAQRTGKPSWGYELGPFGTVTLRVVYPWYSNGKVIGYLEMGIEFEHFIEEVHKLFHVNIFVAIDKKFMNRVNWEQLRKQMGRKADWNEFPSIVVPYRTEPVIPPPIAAYLADLKDRHIRRTFEAVWDKYVFDTIVVPFIDQRGRILGELVILHDISAATAGRHWVIIGITTLCTIIGVALMIFFFILLGRVQKDIAERTSRLTETQRMLAVEQLERQHTEREFGLQQERIGLLEAKSRMVQELIQVKKVLEERSNELQGVNEQLQQEIIDRKRAEDASRKSEERFRSMVETTSDWVWEVDQNGLYTYTSPKVRELLGYEPEEIIGRSPFDLMLPDEAKRVAGLFGEIVGSRKPLIGLENVNQHKDGRCVVLETSGIPIFDTNGDFLGYRGIDRDITERKRMENKFHKLNEQLEQKMKEKTKELLDTQAELVRKEKLAMLGTIAAGMGNELRNPLGVMNNAVYFLKTVLPDPDDTIKEYLDIITAEISNSEHIINDLLGSVRTRTPQKMPVTAGELIEKSLSRCHIPENVDIQTDITDTLPQVCIDPFQMGQVLQNLINNAVQAMPEGGTLTISARLAQHSTSGISGSNSTLNTQHSTLDADFIEISIIDTGKGISPENMENLFQPLFTTKARGIGLGLVVCKNLVEANRGRIVVESEFGRGTTFILTLPLGGKGETVAY